MEQITFQHPERKIHASILIPFSVIFVPMMLAQINSFRFLENYGFLSRNEQHVMLIFFLVFLFLYYLSLFSFTFMQKRQLNH